MILPVKGIKPLNCFKFGTKLSSNPAKSNPKTSDGTDILVENPSVINQDILRQKIIKKRLSMLKPIKNDEEYKEIYKKIIGYLLYDLSEDNEDNQNKPNINKLDNLFGIRKVKIEDLQYISLDGYEHIDFYLKGLVAYCGTSDISRQINEWLTARDNKSSNPTLLSDEQMADIIRVFEYSLRKLDKKFGKYKDVVFRVGYFNPILDKQYYSASKFVSCAVNHAYRHAPSKTVPYSVIRLKSGHDIHKFQNDTASEISMAFALSEREILIDRNSKFRLVPKNEYTDDEQFHIKNIIFQTIDYDLKDVSPKNMKEFSDNIYVWEEI